MDKMDTKVYYEDETMKIRSMVPADAKIFYDTYLSYNWHPQMETYEGYYKEQGNASCLSRNMKARLQGSARLC